MKYFICDKIITALIKLFKPGDLSPKDSCILTVHKLVQNLFGPLQISPSPQSAAEEHLVTQLPAVESNTDTILVNALVVHHLPLR